jgi:hypothetical protein
LIESSTPFGRIDTRDPLDADRCATAYWRDAGRGRIRNRFQEGGLKSVFIPKTQLTPQFVYDPHLAPFVEAFIANHTPRLAQRQPVAVRQDTPSRSSGITSGRQNFLGRLRRRGKGKGRGEEEDGGTELLIPNLNHQDSKSAYELKDQESKSDLVDGSRRGSINHNIKESGHHDEEIKSVIFNISPSPAPAPSYEDYERHPELEPESGRLLPQTDHYSGTSSLSPSPGRVQDPSTTFSFLSLSQVSSPEAPSTMLDSMTFSHLGPREQGPSSGERDVMSEWDSSEGFSNISSPQGGHQGLGSPLDPLYPSGGNSGLQGGLGLNTIGDVGMNYVSPIGRNRSVISLSESEGGGGSDWEAVSATRSS